MTEKPKRSVGRPRKRTLDKPEQFSIRLLPPIKAMLEMMARHEKVSLSRAVEQLISESAANRTIDGETPADLLFERVAYVSGTIKKYEGRFQPDGRLPETIARQNAIFNSRYSVLFLMPEKLLQQDELALVRACLAVERLPSDSDLDALHVDSRTMAALGVDLDQIVKHLVKRLETNR